MSTFGHFRGRSVSVGRSAPSCWAHDLGITDFLFQDGFVVRFRIFFVASGVLRFVHQLKEMIVDHSLGVSYEFISESIVSQGQQSSPCL
jgi:hypothetical protein